MKCPRCGCEHCQIISETTGTMQGFGFCKGIIGYVCLGPIGILCGLCGMGKGKTWSRSFWVCGSCGYKFKA